LIIIEKLEKKCPFFARLDSIWGTRPNFLPPSLFSSGSSSQETADAANTPINELPATQDAIEIYDNDGINKSDEPELDFLSGIADCRSSTIVHER